MLALKRFVTILVMLYVLLALLLILSPGSRDGLASTLFNGDKTAFYYLLFATGAGLLLAQLVTENLDSVLLRRDVATRESKINELKARLYDQQLEPRSAGVGATRTGTTVHPDGYVTPTTPPTPRRPDDAPLA